MISKKVLVGMSGGVDSSVVATMLKEQGYEVHGVFVEAYNEPGCRTDQDKKDALQVALKLGIPFKVLDLRKEYKERVVNYFIDEYKQGRTPNPDIICNRDIKFGLLYEYMIQNGYDYLATGHYARITEVKGTSEKVKAFFIQQPKDLSKDQTYFLWQVAREKLEHILWPLGNVEKSWVRQRAHELGLPNADKPDSMGVCMIGELNVRDFLKEKLGTNPGPVMWKGVSVGSHEGLWFYTIGSRGGFKINPHAQNESMPPLYVVGKEASLNTLVVGVRDECYLSSFGLDKLHLNTDNERDLRVRVRNLGELTPVKEVNGNKASVEEPIFALAPGQSAVFYDSEGVVVGGGIIAEH
ncbi:tRNA 2-thiouridine(34) synthase MnmA [Candidatus Woesebacteria bacterium]|nr:tRNA 2-thiouridine(34) synthase MnmA [Candidatus Woesebacteria bacterium]